MDTKKEMARETAERRWIMMVIKILQKKRRFQSSSAIMKVKFKCRNIETLKIYQLKETNPLNYLVKNMASQPVVQGVGFPGGRDGRVEVCPSIEDEDPEGHPIQAVAEVVIESEAEAATGGQAEAATVGTARAAIVREAVHLEMTCRRKCSGSP